MQEHQHVKTTPGEAKAPEVVPHPIRVEPGTNTQTDDINIPLVAISVAFFAAFLLVLVIGLQAWFYNYDNAEQQRKTVAEGDPRTELGQLLDAQRTELDSPAGVNPRFGKDSKVLREPIDQAMDAVVKRYEAAQANQGHS